MADQDGLRIPDRRAGWRRLGLFWAAVLVVMAAGGGTLQYLGPPAGGVRSAATSHPTVAPIAHGAAPMVTAAAHSGPAGPEVAVHDVPGAIAEADPALLETTREGAAEPLPKIAPDGRTPRKVYAAAFDYRTRRPRVAILLAGIGLNEAESDAAIRALPGSVSLAVSPYAINVTKLLATARTAGHEYFVAVPLEPAGFPLNDPGSFTLMTSASAPTNAKNLHWALSRITGYVGATGVIGTMRGERFAAMTDQMDTMLTELAERGLMYVDPLEGTGPVAKAWGRHADVAIDDPADQGVADRAMIDARLAALEQMARDGGSALGLVMRPTPMTVARLAAWCNGLPDRGLTLAPVSALAIQPEGPVKISEREP